MNKKIITQLLSKGKMTISEKIWLSSIKTYYKSFTKNQKKLINKALVNVAPLLKTKQLKQKKKKMSFKEFPYIIQNKNRIPLALKFFLNKTKQRIDSKTYKKIANEIIYAAQNIGVNLQKKKKIIWVRIR